MEELKSAEKNKNIMDEVLSFFRVLLVCFILVYIMSYTVTRHVIVEGNSMYPTLKNNEEGFTNVFASRFQNDLKRFDVVVTKGKGTTKDWVKRIIAMPGETIEYKDEKLYINGKHIEEKFLDKVYVDEATIENNGVFTNDFGPFTMGYDEYFLMGDNRVISYDSRAVGPFKRSDIESKGVFVVLPFSEMRNVHGE